MFQKLVYNLTHNSIVDAVIHFLEGIPIKHADTNLWVLLKTIYRESVRVDVDMNASAISFNFLMALPPLLLFFFTLLPFLPLQGYDESIYFVLSLILPDSDQVDVVYRVVTDFINNPRSGILSISLILVFYIASNGIFKMLEIFDKYLKVNVLEITNFRRRLKAFQLFGIFIFLYVLLLSFMIGQNTFIESLADWLGWGDQRSHSLLYLSSYLLLILVLMVSLAILYYFGPSVATKWKFFSVGVYVGTIGILLFSYIFTVIASQFVDYNQIYGSIGSLFIMLIWLSTNTRLMLVGFLVNISLDHLKYHDEELPDESN